MNYYEHHLGDWAAATGHLTWDEDMAYTRLLRAYYHHEQAIAEGQQYRLAKAATPAQRKAVDQVLSEFFELRDGRFHQKRADAEIARYQDKQRKAKASAEARWNKAAPHTDRSADAMRTHTEGNAHQTPDTKHQEQHPPTPQGGPPDKPAVSASRMGVTDLVAEGVPQEVAADWLRARGGQRAPLTRTAWAKVVREAKAAGITPAEAVRIAAENSWRGFEAEWLRKPPPKGEPQWAAERRAKAAEFMAPLTRVQPDNVIDLEEINARLALG